MLVVIAFESMFGNTRQVADAVAEGLEHGPRAPRVRAVLASAVEPELMARADLLVVGGPTHYHGLATRTSLAAGRQLQRRAFLTGQLTPRGIGGWGEVGFPRPTEVARSRLAAGGLMVSASPGQVPDGHLPDGDADLRAWLRCLPRPELPEVRAAAFDTRVTSRWAGGAAYAIARRLRRRGYHLVVPPEGFLIDGLLGPLRTGEMDRARTWGDTLRRQLSA